jgi:ABC-2 type transport system ATP-binding protein
MSSFIEVNDVCKKYGNHVALSHVNLKVPDGSIYGLLGPNGAGKTSLIRIINRITHADSGEVLMHGRPMTDEDIRHIGYLPEERGLYKKMKVQDEIVYLARLRGLTKHDAMQRMGEWLERFDLGNWRDKKVEQLSKGMAQKVQFIATVIHRPPLLIFDEPFSGFDPVNTEQLKREILRLRDEGAAILFSTHNMSSVEEVCQEISLINHSEVVLQGRVDEIRHKYRTHQFRVQLEDGQEFDYQLPKGMSIHDAIAQLNAQYPLAGFHEVLPTMQQIFMQAVGAADKLKVNS